MSRAGILSDIRVLDFGSGIAAPLAGMLLAEAGADVIKIEPPEGDAARDLPGFSVWNRSKRSVVLDPEIPENQRALKTLLSGADVLVHDLPAKAARERGWDVETLAARHPGLVVCGIPPYPEGHSDEDREGDDSLVMARMGLMDEQQAVNRPGPVYLRIPLGSFCGAWLAAAGVVARLIKRGRTGHAGAASTSLMQGALVPMTMHWARAGKPSPSFALGLPKNGVPTLFQCGDGIWLHLMRPPEHSPLMRRELESMGEARVAELDAVGPKTPLAPHFGANVEAFKRHDSTTWLEDLWANDVPAQAAVPLGEIYSDKQALANDYVATVDDPVLGRVQQPGHAYTTEPPARIQGPAPRLGADNEAVLGERRERRVAVPEGDATRPPLAGVRVLDFGNFLAGPLAPMLLADLGAEVIKVEATTGDMMRPIARVFDGCQRGKRAIALDLKNPKARPVLERLIAGCDVVHHNLRMPAALRLQLGYDALREIRPDLVYCHVSSYGPRGPRKDWPGFDQLFQAQSGWEMEGAGLGNPPMWHRFGMMDHQCALASLFATLLGIRQRDRTGEGQFVSASLLGASILSVSETVVLPDGSLAPFERLDGDQMGVSHSHRLFICRDGWIVVNAPDPETIAAALGGAHADGLEAAMANRSTQSILDALASAGVPAERLQLDQADTFLESESNRRTGLSARYPHREYGWTEQVGALWQLAPARLSIDRAAPTLGEHSREILNEVGFTADEIESLVDEHVVVARS
jgi:crotonobetainyl-CoA:carnitine CoA-transferase CaiB-like acyl-CoA transferase